MTAWPHTPAHLTRTQAALLVLGVLFVHVWLLSESPAWFSPQTDKQTATHTFVTRQIDISPRAPQTPTQPKTEVQASTSAQPSTPSNSSHDTPAVMRAPLHLDDAHPHLTAPVLLPERAASAVDLPPFQRATTEGQQEPTSFQAPASAVLKYNVQGLAKGFNYQASAELQWQNKNNQYQAQLAVGMFLVGSRTQTSSGQIGSEGLMPTRFSDKNRSELAVHFQREKGVISFSANTPDVPLLKGAQDRLSVVLQLSALLAGDPSRYPAGTMLSFQTVSQREAEVWQFKVDKEEMLSLPYGEVPSIKLQRSPRRDFDQRIELWLAPSLGYLPVRLRITNANGDFVDQLLRSLEKPSP